MKLSELTYNPTNYENRKIGCQPELLIAFLQSKLSHVGRVWLALKFLDYQNAGILTLDYTKEVLCNKESDHYLMSYGNLLKTLHKHNNDFWIFANDKIVIKSPSKIANYFGLDKFGYNSVWIYADQLFSGNAVFNAACYAGYITTLGDVPTSREKIQAQIGLHKTAQIRYEKLAGIEQTAACVIKTKNEIQKKGYTEEDNTRIKLKSGKIIYGKRLGNIRTYNRMIKSTGGKRRRLLNKKIESVEKGKRNQSMRVEHNTDEYTGEKYITKYIGEDKGLYHNFKEASIKKAMQIRYMVCGNFGVRRYAIYGDMPCLLFFVNF